MLISKHLVGSCVNGILANIRHNRSIDLLWLILGIGEGKDLNVGRAWIL